MTALLIGTVQRRAIADLIALAESNPVDMATLPAAIKLQRVKAAHMAKMTAQTIVLPIAFMVTYSVEVGHPAGRCRHLSVSVERADRAPRPETVWMIAEEFGFVGSLDACRVWPEDLRGRQSIAVNVVQPYPV